MTDLVTPLDRYVARQADMRVVERFARSDVAGRTGQWSDLVPLTAPGPGEQYRFEVDLDSCTGCKACVTACHSLNGLDDGESFRSIGALISPSPTPPAPALQTVTTACHHCVDPGCLTGCPAKAYEKDPITGIVKHLDDACIGCQYCTLTCPYEVPLYNDRLGIVRKCDMCADRLGQGEAPACVQGCPTEAITITAAPIAAVSPTADERLITGAAPSALTQPTTLYRGAAVEAGLVPADDGVVTPQHGHRPLVVMLVLSQLSIGIMVAVAVFAGVLSETHRALGATAALFLGVVSAGASFAHLGQPLKAWRVVLGWSHSWLSREALLVGGYLAITALAALLAWSDATGSAASLVAAASAVVGVVAATSSVMIYVVTGRRLWALPLTATRFGGTVLAGLFGWLCLLSASGSYDRWLGYLAAAAMVVVMAAKLVVERSALVSNDPDLRRTARLLTGQLRPAAQTRHTLAGAATALLAVAAVVDIPTGFRVALAVVGLVALVAAELKARTLFFESCAPATMPGALR